MNRTAQDVPSWWKALPAEVRALLREMPAVGYPWERGEREAWLVRFHRAILTNYPGGGS